MRFFGIALVISLATMLLPGVARAEPAPVMLGYVPAFKGIERIDTLPIDHYTHLNIAFANPDADGLLARDGTMTCMSGGAGGNLSVAQLRETAAKLRGKGAKVLLSVAGGVIPACSGDWAALLTADRREAVVAGLLTLVDEAKLDGLDVDIEGALLTQIDRQGDYTPFIALLSKGLKARGKLLTVATASYEGGMIPISSVRYFDLVMPMSYDAIGPSWGQAGAEHSSYAQAEADIALWLARGVKRDRLVLGVPYYGYGFGGYPASLDFRQILTREGDAATGGDVIGDRAAGRYVTFNSPATLARKAMLARDRAAGVMVWEITQDTADQLLARTLSKALSAKGLAD